MALLSSSRSRDDGAAFHDYGTSLLAESVSLWEGMDVVDEERHRRRQQQQQQQRHSSALEGSVACAHHRSPSFGLGLGFGAGCVGFDAPWLIEVLLHRRRLSAEVEGLVGDEKKEDEEASGNATRVTHAATALAPIGPGPGKGPDAVSMPLIPEPPPERTDNAPTRYEIREATEADIPLLGEIERSAGEVFRQVGLAAVADDEPMPAEVLRGYANAGHVWVAVASGGAGAVVGFLACFPIAQHDNSRQAEGRSEDAAPSVTGFLHIAELSVHAAHQKRGLGRRLLDAMLGEVAARPSVLATGFTSDVRWKRGARVVVRGLSLTTYRHLAFNKPFYERMGFHEVAVGEIEGLIGRRGRELWEEEQAGILRPEMRCWMVRDL